MQLTSSNDSLMLANSNGDIRMQNVKLWSQHLGPPTLYVARREGVSRMSAYHHFGMVSPFRVARDALAAGSNGARKFADEFLTWRELSYAFCFHHWRILESFEVRLSRQRLLTVAILAFLKFQGSTPHA